MRTETGLRLGQLRRLGTDTFTWADPLQGWLSEVRVFLLYFRSRFNLPVDATASESLWLFGDETSELTSVDFGDPQDKNFSEALGLFGLRNPPALVLVSGLQTQAPDALDVATLPDALYCISFSDSAVLADRECMASTVNIAHEILMRCDGWEIASYMHGRKIKALLGAIGRGRWQYAINLSGSVPSSGCRGNFP